MMIFKINPFSAVIEVIKYLPSLIWYYGITYGGLILFNYVLYHVLTTFSLDLITASELNFKITIGAVAFFNFILGLNIAVGAFFYKEAIYERKIDGLVASFKKSSDIMISIRYIVILILLTISGTLFGLIVYAILAFIFPEHFGSLQDILFTDEKMPLKYALVSAITVFTAGWFFVIRLLLAIPHALFSQDGLWSSLKLSKFLAEGNRCSFIFAQICSVMAFVGMARVVIFYGEPIAREFQYFKDLAELLEVDGVVKFLNTLIQEYFFFSVPELDADTIIRWCIYIPIISTTFFLWAILGANVLIYTYYKRAFDFLQVQEHEKIEVSKGLVADEIEDPSCILTGDQTVDAPTNAPEDTPPKTVDNKPVDEEEFYNQMYGSPQAEESDRLYAPKTTLSEPKPDSEKMPLSDEDIYSQLYGDDLKGSDD